MDFSVAEQMERRHFAFGAICAVSNRIETAGKYVLGELTVKQWFFLAALTSFFKDPPTLSALAEVIGSSHQNVKQLALRLEEKGYLRIEADLEDRRALRISEEPKAMAYAEEYEKKQEDFLDMFYQGISEEEIQIFSTVLQKVTGNLDRMKEGEKQ